MRLFGWKLGLIGKVFGWVWVVVMCDLFCSVVVSGGSGSFNGVVNGVVNNFVMKGWLMVS